MTDTQPQAKVYAEGDTITVMRGKTRGQTAQVIGVDQTNKTYAVRYTDGTLGTINHVNVKTPDEKTITASALAGLIQATLEETSERGLDPQMDRLISRLTDAGLDTSSKVRMPAESA
jgi:hypothetical protein